jgi:hypothetical protein
LRSISSRLISAEKIIVKNQGISLKRNEIIIDLILKVQGNIKGGFNWLKNIVENGIKFELRNSTAEIIKEFTIKTAMSYGKMNNNLNKLRKGVRNSFDRCQEFMNEKHNMIMEAISRTTKWDDFNARMNENFDGFGLFIRNLM